MDVITRTFPTYTLRGWDLSELLPEPSEQELASRLSGLEAATAAFEQRRADLDPQMEPRAFLAILRQYEELHNLIQVINGYASLWFYSDTGSQEALTFRNRVRQAATEAGNRSLFFTLWWRSLGDDEAWRLLPSDSEHHDYRQYLLDLRRFKPYTLDERSEQLINIKDQNGADAVVTLYSMLTNRLEFNLTVDGEARKLTRDELMSHAFSPEAGMRE
ncbi:MAG TPA: oligoendopeptidase F, partial [Thermoanaerobaculia bacterium]